MALHDDFLDEIERFLRLTGMSATKFGTDAMDDPGFVFGLRAGRSPNLKTVERIRSFINDFASTGSGKKATA